MSVEQDERAPRRRGTGRRTGWLGVAVGLAVLALGALGGYLYLMQVNFVSSQAAQVVAELATVDAPAAGALGRVQVALGQSVPRGGLLVRLDTASGSVPLKAPQAGTVTAVYAPSGAAVTAGQPLFQLLYRGRFEVEALVPETAIDRLAVGNKATVTLVGYPGTSFAGRVLRISPAVEAALSPQVNQAPSAEAFNKTVQLVPVWVSIRDAPSHTLTVGESAQVLIRASGS